MKHRHTSSPMDFMRMPKRMNYAYSPDAQLSKAEAAAAKRERKSKALVWAAMRGGFRDFDDNVKLYSKAHG